VASSSTGTEPAAAPPAATDYDAVIVGGGFAGLYMLHTLRGMGLRCRLFEAGDEVGGVWHWNRYPGARCDLEGRFYCYSFSRELAHEWKWTERYPNQYELLDYAKLVADRFGLRADISLRTRVTAARYDPQGAAWTVSVDPGTAVSCRWLIAAVGCLSVAQVPAFDGLESFRGRTFHTGRWPQSQVDFTGRRVAALGTGSSGVQVIPELARQAARLTVFQRTPSYVLPAHNRPWSRAEQTAQEDELFALRRQARSTRIGVVYDEVDPRGALEVTEAEREAQFTRFWDRGGARFLVSFGDIGKDLRANELAADYVRRRIRQTVTDPETARKLTPTDYPLGAKRPCVGTDYYETFNRDNVTLVDLREDPILRFTEHGIETAGGHHELDDVVFATGYDAITGAFDRIDIRGIGGLALRDKWRAGPRTYLGLATHGFPNLFILAGPGSPSVLANVMDAIEQHVEWLAGLLDFAQRRGIRAIEATADAEDDWVAHVNEVARHTLYVHASSWYLGANVPGKPRVFMPYAGGSDVYRARCEEVAESGYAGFTLAK
jgi:cyclohexanone monooxygenase